MLLLAAISLFTGSLSLEDVRAAATPIKTIDPDHESFEDLSFLKKRIGEARVVMLGEQFHGDGNTFLAKSRLVKFLHKEMGFDVLVWESGMWDVREAWREVKEGKGAKAAFRDSLGMWTNPAQTASLLAYTEKEAKGSRPLEFAGMDPWYLRIRDPLEFPRTLVRFLAPAGDLDPESREFLAGPLRTDHPRAKPEALQAERGRWVALANFVDAHRPALEKAHGANEVAFMRRELLNRASYARYWEEANSGDRAKFAEANRQRDAEMAATVEELLDRHYRGRKLIVWASLSHTTRAPQAIWPHAHPTMAELVDKKRPGQVLSVVFTPVKGEAGWPGQVVKIDPAPADTLEGLVAQLGSSPTFVDLAKLKGDYPARLWMGPPMVREWGRSFDLALVLPEQAVIKS